MTSKKDIIRQVETALNDPRSPLTPEEKERYTTILHRIKDGNYDPGEPPVRI